MDLYRLVQRLNGGRVNYTVGIFSDRQRAEEAALSIVEDGAAQVEDFAIYYHELDVPQRSKIVVAHTTLGAA